MNHGGDISNADIIILLWIDFFQGLKEDGESARQKFGVVLWLVALHFSKVRLPNCYGDYRYVELKLQMSSIKCRSMLKFWIFASAVNNAGNLKNA